MNDLITAATSGLFVEIGKVIEHMKAQQERITDLERQLAEASAPAVEQDKVICANLGELLLTPAQRKAADTDKVREALNKLHSDIMNIPCNALHAASPNQEVQRAYKEGHRDSRHAAAELAASMAAQAPVREVPGWVSVKDHLPEDKQLVWCTRYDGRVHLARRHGNKPLASGEPWNNCYWWDEETGSNWSDVTVSAWMPVAERIRPLPAAPVQQEGDKPSIK